MPTFITPRVGPTDAISKNVSSSLLGGGTTDGGILPATRKEYHYSLHRVAVCVAHLLQRLVCRDVTTWSNH